MGLGVCPSHGLLRGWPGTGVSLTSRVLRPLGHDRCRSCSRLFEKSFLLLPSPIESPIDQPIDDSHGPAAAQRPTLTPAGPAGEAVMGSQGWGSPGPAIWASVFPLITGLMPGMYIQSEREGDSTQGTSGEKVGCTVSPFSPLDTSTIRSPQLTFIRISATKAALLGQRLDTQVPLEPP